jgi:hypothetical protein
VEEGQPGGDDARTISDPNGVPFRIVTWNLNHWQQPVLPSDTRAEAWEHLRSLGASAVLAQEAVPPEDVTRDRAVYAEIGGHRHWGSAVAAMDPGVQIEPIRTVRMPFSRRHYVLDHGRDGLSIARVTIPGIQPLVLVSMYAVWDGPVVGNVFRAAANLLPLFDSPDGARVILGGDLNVGTATTNPRHLARAHAALDAIRSLGLVDVKSVVSQPPAPLADCPCERPAECTHLATWGTAELDYLFISPGLTDQVVGLSTDQEAVNAGLSDHVPLVLDLALTAARTPQVWDEEAFAVEIGRRHGPEAMSVVTKVITWADHLERELTTQAGVASKVLTRFPTNGVTNEPELSFPLDLQVEPRGVQPTISIRADGSVTLLLGSMRHAPFDAPAARESLRAAMNAIPGLALPSGTLYPRLRLDDLADASTLAAFVGVLERVVRETGAPPR